ncbi:MAG: Rrf2 family transcriptional regulator [Candidatus Staskawiczbacteria bacterium]|jgi:Rrf2 family protein
MNISKKSQYGLRAMVFLAKNFKSKKFSLLKDVSEKEAIPFDFLEKILSDLEKTKLVKGKKGIGGGYILAKNPKKITAKDIVDPLENTTAVDCRFCGKSRKCLTKNVWRKIDVAINKTLKSITLADLIR